MKYTILTRKYWKFWIKCDIQRLYYSLVHKFNMGEHGTMLPQTGKGKYVSVYTKGQIIQIVDETEEYNEIRIIPYQPNHGVMVEQLKNGKVHRRDHLNIRQLNKGIIFASNVEQLANRKPNEQG